MNCVENSGAARALDQQTGTRRSKMGTLPLNAEATIPIDTFDGRP